jgi:hypothetical protein
MSQQQTARNRGIADIVFLLDVTGSMSPCIDALKRNIGMFIDTLSHGQGTDVAPVSDWRAKVVGYRDWDYDQEPFVDAPFVRDAESLKGQLDRLQAAGGGDEPESLLDALYTVANMGESGKDGQAESADRWRPSSGAARVVVVFTDASFKPTMSVEGARGGSIEDLFNLLMGNGIILSLFAPDMECYDRLSQLDRCEWEPIGEPGESPQQALAEFTSDQQNFRNTMKQLAASVSKSAQTVAL